jgi:oxalate decarboxylase/phosphoglucose isomerase-like protein (cupin superfamily)
MTDEVHVTTSQSDAAKMIVERNSANGKPTPDAIRKIADAQPEPESEPADRPRHSASAQGRFRTVLTRMFPGRTAAEGIGLKKWSRVPR